jgi:hypothetical protein
MTRGASYVVQAWLVEGSMVSSTVIHSERAVVGDVTTQHIGAAGELLVQYRLLKHEVDSARLTTDSGMDLVAYSPLSSRAVTIQVKTVLKPVPAGGKGAPAHGWWFPDSCKADLLALVRLSTDSVWLFTLPEARDLSQQHNKGRRQLYWYAGAHVPPGSRAERDVERYLLDARVYDLFLGAAADRVRAHDDHSSGWWRESNRTVSLGTGFGMAAMPGVLPVSAVRQ